VIVTIGRSRLTTRKSSKKVCNRPTRRRLRSRTRTPTIQTRSERRRLRNRRPRVRQSLMPPKRKPSRVRRITIRCLKIESRQTSLLLHSRRGLSRFKRAGSAPRQRLSSSR